MSTATRATSRRKLFAPTPIASTTTSVAAVTVNGHHSNGLQDDAALAAAISASESRRSYSLRRRAETSSPAKASSGSGTPNGSQHKRMKRSRAATPSSASDGSDFSADEAGSSDGDSDVFTDRPAKTKASPKRKAIKSEDGTSTPRKTKKASSTPTKPKKEPISPFAISPRKPSAKPIKLNLEPHEAHPAPPHWETVYSLLSKQRSKIIAPVDTMGCEENGRHDRRADSNRPQESAEDSAKRERLATLVSLMLSSQTKDPVTAEAVYNLQRNLPGGLCLKSLLEAKDEDISSCIAKVGFWRRKTGYLKSAAKILSEDFGGDVPRTVDELCSLPGVGPKMAFLALSSMGIQVGIGVDTHVHRLSNRLGWHRTQTPEQTRLNLQSWLPQELHGKINRLLVGFGQVICVPVGPRCDLCDVGKAGLCPSRRDVDERSVEKRVKVELLDSGDEGGVWKEEDNWVKVKREGGEAKVKVEMELDGPEGRGLMEVSDLTEPLPAGVKIEMKVKEEEQDAATVERALEW